MRGSVVSTRWERSPPAIAAAVWPMRSSGSSPTRTTTEREPADEREHAARSRSPSTSSNRSSASLVASIGIAATVVVRAAAV